MGESSKKLVYSSKFFSVIFCICLPSKHLWGVGFSNKSTKLRANFEYYCMNLYYTKDYEYEINAFAAEFFYLQLL